MHRTEVLCHRCGRICADATPRSSHTCCLSVRNVFVTRAGNRRESGGRRARRATRRNAEGRGLYRRRHPDRVCARPCVLRPRVAGRRAEALRRRHVVGCHDAGGSDGENGHAARARLARHRRCPVPRLRRPADSHRGDTEPEPRAGAGRTHVPRAPAVALERNGIPVRPRPATARPHGHQGLRRRSLAIQRQRRRPGAGVEPRIRAVVGQHVADTIRRPACAGSDAARRVARRGGETGRADRALLRRRAVREGRRHAAGRHDRHSRGRHASAQHAHSP